jgi:hypothetical protein
MEEPGKNGKHGRFDGRLVSIAKSCLVAIEERDVNKTKPKARCLELGKAEQILLRVVYISCPTTWKECISLLKWIDGQTDVSRDYTTEAIFVALVKLQSAFEITPTTWDSSKIRHDKDGSSLGVSCYANLCETSTKVAAFNVTIGEALNKMTSPNIST